MSGKTKIIIAVIGLIVIGLLAYFIYRYTSKAEAQVNTSTTTSTTSGHGGLADLLGGFLPLIF